MPDIQIDIPGYGEWSLSGLKEDVEASYKKGMRGEFAFIPETVEGLIDKIEELLLIINDANNNDKG